MMNTNDEAMKFNVPDNLCSLIKLPDSKCKSFYE